MSMWSLVQIPNSKLTATLEILHSLGVDQEDFREIRNKPVFAQEIARVFASRRKLIDDAINGRDTRTTITALEGIFDKKTLVDVALRTKQRSIVLWILSHKGSSDIALAIAKKHESRAVVEEALMRVSTQDLTEWQRSLFNTDNWLGWALEKELESR